MRKVKLTWAELSQILAKVVDSNGSPLLMGAGQHTFGEEIKEITLIKPKEVLIYARERIK